MQAHKEAACLTAGLNFFENRLLSLRKKLQGPKHQEPQGSALEYY